MNELVIAVIGTLIAALMAYEVQAWFPRICDGLIELAVKRLPKRQRPRYAEEWRGHITQVPGAVMKIWHALGFVSGAGSMFPHWQRRIVYRRTVARTILANRITIRLLDLAIAVPLLIMLAPLLAVVTLVNSITGPSLYRAKIKSPDGTVVSVLKFRTMRVAEAGRYQVTRFGGFIRWLRIDELPKLVSVFFGEMSFITLDKPGIIPAKFSLPALRTRQPPMRTGLAYIGTIWRVYWKIGTGQI